MEHRSDQIRYRLPGSEGFLVAVVIGAIIYLISILLQQPRIGLFLGFVAWFVANRWTYRLMVTKILKKASAMEASGDLKGACQLLEYAAGRMKNNLEILRFYIELHEQRDHTEPRVTLDYSVETSATAEVVEYVEESLPEIDDELPSIDERVEPVLSRSAVWILCLLPFIFFPFTRQSFPHIGLWFPSMILVLSIKLRMNPLRSWDKNIAKAGLTLSIIALGLFGLTTLSEGLTGADLGFRLDLESSPISWPVKIAYFLALIISIVLHESAHAITAFFSGDSTAAKQGRISLNPIHHVDLFGSILLPGIMLMAPGGVVFGWAKPVPVNPENYRNYRRGNFAVSISGVAINFMLALFSTSLLMTLGVILHRIYPGLNSIGFAGPYREVILTGLPNAAIWVWVIEFLKAGVMVNIILLSLNALPIPPLDGYGILESLMPKGMHGPMAKFRGVGSWLFLALLFFRVLSYLLIPGILLAALLMGGAGFIARLG